MGNFYLIHFIYVKICYVGFSPDILWYGVQIFPTITSHAGIFLVRPFVTNHKDLLYFMNVSLDNMEVSVFYNYNLKLHGYIRFLCWQLACVWTGTGLKSDTCMLPLVNIFSSTCPVLLRLVLAGKSYNVAHVWPL